ncbi:hypothetical protein B0H13DRAFT_2008029 [Mycena leptocephala]|nr:hypothetical protein B0H13DRAFT_2008029 [Mycena leptocephala]
MDSTRGGSKNHCEKFELTFESETRGKVLSSRPPLGPTGGRFHASSRTIVLLGAWGSTVSSSIHGRLYGDYEMGCRLRMRSTRECASIGWQMDALGPQQARNPMRTARTIRREEKERPNGCDTRRAGSEEGKGRTDAREFLENMIGKRLKSKISVASSTDMDHDARKESEASIRPSASSTIAWGVTKTTLWAMLGCARGWTAGSSAQGIRTPR